jgi:hypothetical protein
MEADNLKAIEELLIEGNVPRAVILRKISSLIRTLEKQAFSKGKIRMAEVIYQSLAKSLYFRDNDEVAYFTRRIVLGLKRNHGGREEIFLRRFVKRNALPPFEW